MSEEKQKAILLLHGSRQTGELLLGRMAKLRSKLLKQHNIKLVSMDAPFRHPTTTECSERTELTWWKSNANTTSSDKDDENKEEYRCHGLVESLRKVHTVWTNGKHTTSTENKQCHYMYEGIIGFSQGARLAHYIAAIHQNTNGSLFAGLKYVMICAGYDDPMPSRDLNEFVALQEESCNSTPACISSSPNFCWDDVSIAIPSLHVFGESDRLIPSERSRGVMMSYTKVSSSNISTDCSNGDGVKSLCWEHTHGGGHHVPMRAANTQCMLDFIGTFMTSDPILSASTKEPPSDGRNRSDVAPTYIPPNEEHEMYQLEELEVMEAIFPDEFRLLSAPGNHPIELSIRITNDDDADDLWPPQTLELRVKYPSSYPDVALKYGGHAGLLLVHTMNVFEFPSVVERKCLDVMEMAAIDAGEGVPHVLACITAIREFFDMGGFADTIAAAANQNGSGAVDDDAEDSNNVDRLDVEDTATLASQPLLPSVSQSKLDEADEQGAQIALSLLGFGRKSENSLEINGSDMDELGSSFTSPLFSTKGGSWKFVIGLVGKPSAGKSTVFNAATAFARQRNGQGYGASMAPHPFTTIDPNVGFCFVPAPSGSCPEEDECNASHLNIGSTHGRDSRGRRLLPVMLKDVAGLVPGAYEGRGKGNKFLDDLTDADVLIHVVDASGRSDSEGNIIGTGTVNDPMDDLAWVRNELLLWIVTNLSMKWDGISRKGRGKLVDMFSGYKQQQHMVWNVLLHVEKFMYEQGKRERPLDNLDKWDAADLRRLVSAFLGTRFPISLALNKSDIPSAEQFVTNIKKSLPIHGAHAGISLCARQEMEFVRQFMPNVSAVDKPTKIAPNKPEGVWDTLNSAISLREPVLVFPVSNLNTYESLPGMNENASRDASLPNAGMIDCLRESGGRVPSMWNGNLREYDVKHNDGVRCALRDVVVMKQGSTVEDVFLHLKNIRALSGEFVRAEGARNIGEKGKPVSKFERMGKHNRILKIMTNKRKAWQ